MRASLSATWWKVNCVCLLLTRGEADCDLCALCDELFAHSDPLIRGSFSFCVGTFSSLKWTWSTSGNFICGYLWTLREDIYPFDESANNNVNIPKLLDKLLHRMKDPSSVTTKLVCKALGKCLKVLTAFNTCCLYKENYDWAIKIFLVILSSIQTDTYWLVKSEVSNNI